MIETIKDIKTIAKEFEDLRIDSLAKLKSQKFENKKYGIGINFNLKKLELDKLNKKDFEINQNKLKNSIQIEGAESIDIQNHKKEKIIELLKQSRVDEAQFNLHNSVFQNGKVIIVKSNTKADIKINTESKESTDFHTIIIIVEKFANANITEISRSTDQCKYKSQITIIEASESSTVNYNHINLNNESTNVYSIKRIIANKDSNNELLDVNLGGNFTQSSAKCILAEKGASANNNGVFFTNNKQVFDLDIESVHLASNTNSNINTKGALNDKSRAIYRSNINVDPNCKQISGHQIEKTLLLSSNARIDAVPNLEIDNNDVEISHGVAISDIEEEQLFYLKSRGIEEQKARELIINGFLLELLSELNENTLSELEKEISKKAQNTK